ncbi:PQQ-dependent sugar dehydrogenase [Nonomuraea jiangxiensis]|uniref:Glucose/arabinose dehydrogenase, beta-propeller fold n=1 Tax=Nonomuraea jiangxiensis TaxID=633440 RepID=A0A1G8Y3U0_9ACTN|nr:PQQ-dependent sugar dehydrogenase [Nonomuraea jiangxiensis]SDJ97333.1 Glucose/arabinose dehydrogenase, beta-propeller fold [Nonomuraea jiangxiensis]
MRARVIPALILALVAMMINVPEARAQVVGGFDFSRAEVSVTGLQVPWALAFLPDGSALASERNTGRIMRVRPGQAPAQAAVINGVSASGESGLLGIAVSPSYAQDGWVYAYFTSTSGDNRLVRFQLSAPQTQTVLFSGVPSATIHDGGRIAFGPDGMLYVATGDAGATSNAQNLNSPAGKILRMTPTGGIPSGNPFANSRVWSYGHRNVQGLAWDGQGRMYATEFGQNTWDEINQIVAGGNYGWPTCEGNCGNSSFRNPIVTWTTAQASPSGLAYANNTLFAAGLRGQRLWAVPLTGSGSAGTPVAEFQSAYGRLRAVAVGPDGWLWVATSNRDGRGTPVAQDDRIIRVPPATSGGDTTPPTAPAGLVASGTTAAGTTLTWRPSTDNVGVTGYDVLRAAGSSGGAFAQVGTSATTSFTNTGLTPGTTYRYQVRARDAAGNLSPVSNTVTVTTSPGGGTGGCSVTATTQSQWQTGYVVQPVTVTNTGTSTINGWTVTFSLPSGHTTTGYWNAVITTGAQTVTVRNSPNNGTLAPGQSTSFGFQASRPGGDSQTPSGYQCTSP